MLKKKKKYRQPKMANLYEALPYVVHEIYIDQVNSQYIIYIMFRGDVNIQVAATATVCSCLQKVAILLFQFESL